ncbi:MAG TPA: hypothetical protein VFH45_08445 [Acidimicrobiales bacterium]|nr:hypothetical protein [Acidimicrobiales bacterium]
MLTPFDDYPIHQTSAPVAVPASGDRNFFDRYFFNGYTADGSLYFATAFGMYPNREVADAAFSVARGGRQVSVHASGLCPLDRTRTAIGPIRVVVEEPMRRHSVHVDAPDHGLRAELTFQARGGPVMEEPFRVSAGVRTVMDYTRLTQFGSWTGWVEVDGERVELPAGAVPGSRDRSWGVRQVGERNPGPPGAFQFFWLWAPVNFDDFATHFDVNEDADGERWHQGGYLVPAGEGEVEKAKAVDHRITWRPGTRWADRAEIDLALPSGDRTVVLEPILEFQMMGLGYLHPEWGHGVWKGELAVAGERWDLPVAEPLAPQHLHVQALCRATMGDRTGVGILEQLVIGPHAPSGLTGLLDGAQG